MVKVSTLVYVLESLEENSKELFDFDEVLDMESKYLEELFGKIDRTSLILRPEIIDKILQEACTM